VRKKIFIVNPWIEDFSAFDQWIKPVPLLKIARWLKDHNFEIYFVDCLDRSIWGGKTKKWNSGKFRETVIEKPDVLSFVPRKFRIFGGTPGECYKILKDIKGVSYIFTGIPITYWYTGFSKLTHILKELFPEAIIVAGGNYATLLPKHAESHCKIDLILTASNYNDLEKKISRLLDFKPVSSLFEAFSDLSFYPNNNKTTSILTTQGCPFKCTYCAVPILYSGIHRRSVKSVISEITYFAAEGIEDVAFFDDALLVDGERYFREILKEIIKRKIPLRFHLPNAIHARYLTQEIADLMMEANFKTVRIGVENIDENFSTVTGGKVNAVILEKAVSFLKKAGFTHEEVGAYVMFGAPGEEFESVKRSVEFVHHLGIKSILVTYSPVPGTPDFKRYAQSFPEILREPLLHNKVIPMYIHRSEYEYLKRYSDSLNRKLLLSSTSTIHGEI